jgi:hypothetical protein
MSKESVEVKNDTRDLIQKTFSKSIFVTRAEFIHAVNNADDVPESNFSIASATKSRQVKMWWIPGDGLLCFQNNKYFFVPSGMVKFVKFE